MENLRSLPLDVRLSALLDGETSPAEREELERLLGTDKHARALYEELKRGSEFGRTAFDDILTEPVPLSLVRSIKNAEPPKGGPGPEAEVRRRRFAVTPARRQAMAAAVALFALGGTIGYIVGAAPASVPQPVEVAQAPRTWLDDIAAYHRVYARQQRHLVEVPASEKDHIVSWLGSSVGVGFKVPDLKAQGLEFQGARLLVADGKPVAQLIYKGIDGDIVAICFMKAAATPEEKEEGLDEVIRDDIGMVYWHNDQASYVLVGPSSEATLTELARKVAVEI